LTWPPRQGQEYQTRGIPFRAPGPTLVVAIPDMEALAQQPNFQYIRALRPRFGMAMSTEQLYIIVQSSKAETLALYVSERMAAGYRPLGAPFYVPPSSVAGGAQDRISKSGIYSGIYSQAMVHAGHAR
jgi:phosphopantetheine adenylyltransferase